MAMDCSTKRHREVDFPLRGTPNNNFSNIQIGDSLILFEMKQVGVLQMDYTKLEQKVVSHTGTMVSDIDRYQGCLP